MNSISELNNKSGVKTSGGGSIFSFFPNIPGKVGARNGKKSENKAKFPAPKSFFNRNIYVQYLTGKIEREQQQAEPPDNVSLMRIHQQQNLLPKSFARSLERRHQSCKSFTTSSSFGRGHASKSKLMEHATSFSAMDSTEKQVFVDFKGISSPPPSQLAKPVHPKVTKTKAQQSQVNARVRNVNPRFRNYDKIFRNENKAFQSKSFSNNKHAESKAPLQPTSFSTISHQKPFKKIIDLNQLNNNSKLASHYLAFNSASHLSELKLYDVWPGSKMYKVTIKSNPWVDKYKSLSYAHEINDSFRHFNPSNKLPNILKQVF